MIIEFLFVFLLVSLIYLSLKYIEAKSKINEKAFELFQKWKEKELEKEAKLLFEKWKIEEEKRIREDAIEKSSLTILGKVSEQLAPLILFKNYNINLKDLRFIGSPIDFIAFKNLSEDKPEKILFIEVKFSKNSQLSEKERMVRDLINKKKIEFLEINIEDEIKKLKLKKLDEFK
ncbi:MAG: Holliday junction resolvase-like protein [Candidatus Aenigmatarchaeota archaeon]